MIAFVRQYLLCEPVLGFAKETLLLLPFLFVTYLVLEALEAKADGALEKSLERARSVGPVAGALAGVVPQCGVSAAAASLYAGGVITVGALVAVFLSTSDELLPVFLSQLGKVPPPNGNAITTALLAKIVGLKVAAAVIVGFVVDGTLVFFRHVRRNVTVGELCEHSHCGCREHRGILVPALIHTGEIFLFIVVISGAIELCMHHFGADCLQNLRLNAPVFGEIAAGAIGLIPNCAVSVAGAQLYCSGAMSSGALLASSFTGSGLGLLVLFRTNRNLRENLFILAVVYVTGVLFGLLAGGLL